MTISNTLLREHPILRNSPELATVSSLSEREEGEFEVVLFTLRAGKPRKAPRKTPVCRSLSGGKLLLPSALFCDGIMRPVKQAATSRAGSSKRCGGFIF